MQDWAPNVRALFESMQDEKEEEDDEVEEEEDENKEEGIDLSKREVTFMGKDIGTTEPAGEAMVVTLDLTEMAEIGEDVRWSPMHQR